MSERERETPFFAVPLRGQARRAAIEPEHYSLSSFSDQTEGRNSNSGPFEFAGVCRESCVPCAQIVPCAAMACLRGEAARASWLFCSRKWPVEPLPEPRATAASRAGGVQRVGRWVNIL